MEERRCELDRRDPWYSARQYHQTYQLSHIRILGSYLHDQWRGAESSNFGPLKHFAPKIIGGFIGLTLITLLLLFALGILPALNRG